MNPWIFWLTLIAPGVFLAALAALMLATGALLGRVAAWRRWRAAQPRTDEERRRDDAA